MHGIAGFVFCGIIIQKEAEKEGIIIIRRHLKMILRHGLLPNILIILINELVRSNMDETVKL